MSETEMALAAPEVEVVAKATRRRFTVEYKRKIATRCLMGSRLAVLQCE